MDKYLITKSFDKAAHTYNSVANIQALSAAELVSLIEYNIEYNNVSSILDIGCGTGIASLEVYKKYPNASYTLCDISESMLRVAINAFPKRAEIICCDAENYDFPYHDLVISNLSMQWFSDINMFIEKTRANCRNIAFSTLLEGSFLEYQQLFNISPTFTYKSNEEFLNAFTFKAHKVKEYKIQFKNFFGVARYFRKLGANMNATNFKNSIPFDYGPITLNYKIFFGLV